MKIKPPKRKRKILEIKSIKKKRYKILFREKEIGVEIRQYFPCKRTITIAGRQYFLHFPYILFARSEVPNLVPRKVKLSVAFCNRELYQHDMGEVVFHPPLPNLVPFNLTCLDVAGHYWQSAELSFAALLNKFWTYGFSNVSPWQDSDISLHVFFGGRYKVWEQLSTEEVLAALQKSKIGSDFPNLACSLSEFIERAKGK